MLQFGSSYAFSLLKGTIGNFDDFLSQCGEDVVVLGHTHQWRGHRIKNRTGKSIYINTGAWINFAHEVRGKGWLLFWFSTLIVVTARGALPFPLNRDF